MAIEFACLLSSLRSTWVAFRFTMHTLIPSWSPWCKFASDLWRAMHKVHDHLKRSFCIHSCQRHRQFLVLLSLVERHWWYILHKLTGPNPCSHKWKAVLHLKYGVQAILLLPVYMLYSQNNQSVCTIIKVRTQKALAIAEWVLKPITEMKLSLFLWFQCWEISRNW